MKRSLTVLLAFVMALCASFALCAPAWAGDNNLNGGSSRSGSVKAGITSFDISSEVYQGSNYGMRVSFSLETKAGDPFAEGDTVSVETNLGDLFDADWGSLGPVCLYDANKNELARLTFDAAGKNIIFTVGKVDSGTAAISGTVTIPSKLVAKNMGATPENSVEKELELGGITQQIIFKQANSSSGEQDMGSVDIDVFWKNGWSNAEQTGAVICLEVNPIGSMDLYGYTTNSSSTKRTPVIHDDLFIKDVIPEKGFIDTKSMEIYAAVPSVAMTDKETTFNTWYTIPAGTYYARRVGTMRYDIRNRMKQLEQAKGETVEEFEERIKGADLSWGIYRADDGTQTFMCNFGRVGDAENNNGIMYGDYDPNIVTRYPDIFGDDAYTGGNIVSYYIEFDTYYPEIIGEKKVTNYASRTSYENNSTVPSTSGNSSVYTINNGGGTGVVQPGTLAIRLVDEETKAAIAGATFCVQEWDSDSESWVNNEKLVGTTDADGRLSFEPFPAGKYRIVQKTWADGYVEGVTVFGESGNASVGNVSANGEFTVTGNERFGFGTVITNRKVSEITLNPVSVTAYTGGDSQNGTSFPAIRYSISGIDNDSIADLTFEFASDDPNGANSEFKAQKVGDNLWILPRLKNTFTLAGTDGKAAEDDAVPGIYEIGIEPGKLTATLTTEGEDGTAKTTTYDVVLASGHSATVTVRNVSVPDDVLDNEVDIAQPVVSDAKDVDTSDGVGIAMISEDATYHTNGSDSGLGLLGDTASGKPEISLLFDDLIPGEEGEDTAQLLIDRANKEEGASLSKETSQLKYLDLINEHDGNVWVSSDKDVTIYWPIPENAPKDEAANFKVYHFEGLHREYRDNLSDQVNSCEVTPIDCKVEGNNVVFTLKADAANGCFSPFALAWDAPYTVEYYYENEGEYPAVADASATRYAKAGAEVSATEADETPDSSKGNYVLDEEASTLEGTVAADGSLVLKVYFKQQFTVTYTDGVEGEEVFADQVTSGIGYGDQTPAFEGGTPSRAGYTFAGWAPEVADTVTADATYVAQWAPIWNPGPGPDDPDPDTPEPDDPEPDNPEPEDPDTPDNPDPDDPDNPNTPDDPDDPDQPDPDQPSDPEDPGEPSDPDQPTGDTPDPDTPASTPGDSNLPQTGDASLLIAGAAASASVTAFAAAAVVRKRK